MQIFLGGAIQAGTKQNYLDFPSTDSAPFQWPNPLVEFGGIIIVAFAIASLLFRRVARR